MKKILTLCLLSISFSNVALAQFQENERNKFYKQEWENLKHSSIAKTQLDPDSTIDVKFYYLDLKIAVDSQFIAGNVHIKFQPTVNNVNTIRLNLHPSMIVDSVTMDAVSHVAVNDKILINLKDYLKIGDSADVKIYYHGVPILANNIKGLRYSIHGTNEPVIASLSTPFLSHYWWPCKDGTGDKADSVFIDITIKDTIINEIPLIAISNGLLEDVDSVPGIYKTFKWRHRYPIVPYYIMVAISNYRIINHTYTGTKSTFPLIYYVFNENYLQSLTGVAQIPAALKRFIQLFGDYPFENEKYGMTELGYYGAIENQTNTIINKMDSSWYYTFVHELAHQWFGDMITCENWHHAWLNEGFATYSEALITEHLFGFDSYKEYMRGFTYYEAGTLYLPQDTNAFNIFNGIIYCKGAYTLHMLRGVLGDTTFFDCLFTYATSSQLKYNHATTEDFREICETTSRNDLQYFFDQWIYDQYYPVYAYNFFSDPSIQTSALTICQNQYLYGWRPVFKMPLQIKILFSTGTDTLITVMNDQQNQTYYFSFTDSVVDILIDPDKWVLREVYFDNSIHVSINGHKDNLDFNVYPNPASEAITVSINSVLLGSEYIITDLSGKIVLKGKLSSEKSRININELSNGMYLFKIETHSKQIFKVLKE